MATALRGIRLASASVILSIAGCPGDSQDEARSSKDKAAVPPQPAGSSVSEQREAPEPNLDTIEVAA